MLRDKKGMSLLEVLIALVLLMITSLALIQTVLLATDTNVINALRDEAVGVAEDRMNELRTLPLIASDLTATSNAAEPAKDRVLRGFGQSFPFTPRRTVTDLGTGNKQVTLTITWTYKSQQYTHTVSTILMRQ